MTRLWIWSAVIATSTWLLTYAAHGTLVQAAALLAGRVAVRSPKHRAVLWKAALLIPFATATIASAGLRPIATMSDLSLPDLVRPRVPPRWDRYVVEERVLRRGPMPVVVSAVSTDTFATALASIALGLALVTAAYGLIRLIRRRRAFHHRLRDRRPVAAGELSAEARDAAHPMRLTLSATITAPVALGRSEICISRSTLCALTPAQQQSVILHERAHLMRRDPFWFALADAIVAAMPWQPLIRPVRGALRRDAEFTCDDSVKTAMGHGRPLVHALAKLAVAFDLGESAVAASCNGSPLEQRARHLLSPMAPKGRLDSRWLVAGAATLMAGLAATVPAVSMRTAVPPKSRLERAGVVQVIDTTATVGRFSRSLTPPASRPRG